MSFQFLILNFSLEKGRFLSQTQKHWIQKIVLCTGVNTHCVQKKCFKLLTTCFNLKKTLTLLTANNKKNNALFRVEWPVHCFHSGWMTDYTCSFDRPCQIRSMVNSCINPALTTYQASNGIEYHSLVEVLSDILKSSVWLECVTRSSDVLVILVTKRKPRVPKKGI